MTVVVDALVTSHPDREAFEDLRAGNIGCATMTVGFWDDTLEALDHLARWRDAVRDNSDLVAIATNRPEIDAIIASGRTALVLGFQNTDQFQNRIRYIELFADLGVRVSQLTYNNQNAIGGSCYEAHDSGLARFGKEVITEMNSVGMLIDLSHVGLRTGKDVIAFSEKPVAVTHANPSAIYPHLRNKDDELIQALAEKGGVIGMVLYPNVAGGPSMTLDQWIDMTSYAIEVAGIDHVGFGSDYATNHAQADLDWMRVGRWSRVMNFGAGSASNAGLTPWPEWFKSGALYPGVIDGFRRRGFSEEEIDKLAHANWLRLYGEVFPS